LIGSDDYSMVIEKSSDGNALCISGQCATYILKLKKNLISLYKITVRDANNEWTEETPVFGQEKMHIDGFKRHYSIQVPFVPDDVPDEELDTYMENYVQLRQKQREEAVNAI